MLLTIWTALLFGIFTLVSGYALHVEHLADLRYLCIQSTQQMADSSQLLILDTEAQQLNRYFEQQTQAVQQKLAADSHDVVEAWQRPSYHDKSAYGREQLWAFKINNEFLCGITLRKRGNIWERKFYFSTKTTEDRF